MNAFLCRRGHTAYGIFKLYFADCARLICSLSLFPLSDSCHSMLIFEGIINQNVLLNKVNLTSICLGKKQPGNFPRTDRTLEIVIFDHVDRKYL